MLLQHEKQLLVSYLEQLQEPQQKEFLTKYETFNDEQKEEVLMGIAQQVPEGDQILQELNAQDDVQFNPQMQQEALPQAQDGDLVGYDPSLDYQMSGGPKPGYRRLNKRQAKNYEYLDNYDFDDSEQVIEKPSLYNSDSNLAGVKWDEFKEAYVDSKGIPVLGIVPNYALTNNRKSAASTTYEKSYLKQQNTDIREFNNNARNDSNLNYPESNIQPPVSIPQRSRSNNNSGYSYIDPNIQRALLEKGFYENGNTNDIDGKRGQKTDKAIQNYFNAGGNNIMELLGNNPVSNVRSTSNVRMPDGPLNYINSRAVNNPNTSYINNNALTRTNNQPIQPISNNSGFQYQPDLDFNSAISNEFDLNPPVNQRSIQNPGFWDDPVNQQFGEVASYLPTPFALTRIPGIGKVAQIAGNKFITSTGVVVDRSGKLIQKATASTKEFFKRGESLGTQVYTNVTQGLLPNAAKRNAKGQFEKLADTRGGLQKLPELFSKASKNVLDSIRSSIENGKRIAKETYNKLNKTEQKKYDDLFNSSRNNALINAKEASEIMYKQGGRKKTYNGSY